jgi:hypothetical protein
VPGWSGRERIGLPLVPGSVRPAAVRCHEQPPTPIRKVDVMEWVPVVFLTFKVLVFGTCMFLAIKWHYDQDRKMKRAQREPAPRRAGAARDTAARSWGGATGNDG